MALLATQTIIQAGLVTALQAANAGGDQFTPASTTFLTVKNSDTGPHTVTVVTTASEYGQPISNVAVIIAAGATVLIGPFDPGEVAQPGTNLANITYSAVTGVTIAAVNCPSV